MSTKFSQFNFGGPVVAGDQVAGLRNGNNILLDAPSLANLAWNTLLVGQGLMPNNGYFMANAAPAVYTLPAVCVVGELIEIVNIGASTFTIAQNAGQYIQFGNMQTTVGVAGSIGSLQRGDSLTLICFVANNNFVVLGGSQGNWNIV